MHTTDRQTDSHDTRHSMYLHNRVSSVAVAEKITTSFSKEILNQLISTYKKVKSVKYWQFFNKGSSLLAAVLKIPVHSVAVGQLLKNLW